MRGNIVLAATIAGLSAVLACAILVVGLRWALVGAADRLSVAVEHHADQTRAAGDHAGEPIGAALDRLAGRVDKHSGAIEHAGESISQAKITFMNPVRITEQEPLRI